jgi:transglutaminase/protease-like cytokinesis protein 3
MVEATIEDLASSPVFRGNLMQSDGYAVSSTCERSVAIQGIASSLTLLAMTYTVHNRREKRWGNGVKNLHGSKTISKNIIKASAA